MSLWYLIICASFSSVVVKGDCSVDEHHPENGGYFIEGIAGHDKGQIDPNSSSKGLRVNSTWAPGVSYPDGAVVLCEGMFCSEECRKNGCPVFIEGHTCSWIQFKFTVGSDVWLLPNEKALADCDFENAELLAAEGLDDTTYNFPVEEDAELKTYLFASQKGCAAGQKAAVRVADFDGTGVACYGMGETSSKIKQCTCSNEDQDTPSTLSEPCHSQFVAGCLSNAPVFAAGDDKSCCETGTCLGNHINYEHPKGKTIEEGRKKICRNDIPGRCLSSTDATINDCCTKTCEECGTDSDPFFQWAQCSTGFRNNNTGYCGSSSSGHGMGAMEPYVCDFSKCEKDHTWHTETPMYQEWVTTVDPPSATDEPATDSSTVDSHDGHDHSSHGSSSATNWLTFLTFAAYLVALFNIA